VREGLRRIDLVATDDRILEAAGFLGLPTATPR